MTNKLKIPQRKILQSLYEKKQREYNKILRRIFRRIQKILQKNNLNFTIKLRIKSFKSYLDKLIQLHRDKEPVLITDLFGLRIVCPFLEDVEKVKELIKSNFSVQEIEAKDSMHTFREFGYDSTHFLIDFPFSVKLSDLPYIKCVCEIQLRTILQEAWAEVEHELIYKASLSLLTEPIRRKMAALNASLNLADIIFQDIRDYQKEIQKRRRKQGQSVESKLLVFDEINVFDTLNPVGNRKKDTQALSIKPKSQLEKLLFEALDAHSNGEFNKAILIYSHILRIKISKHIRSIIYNHRGTAYLALSEYQQAILDLNKAVEYNPENTRALNNRALTYRILKEYKYAINDLNRSLSIDEYQLDAYYSRALVHYDLNDYVRALKDCDEVLNIKPDFSAGQKLKSIIQTKL